MARLAPGSTGRYNPFASRGQPLSENCMAKVLILLTLPEPIRNQYRDRLRKRFPEITIELVDIIPKSVLTSTKRMPLSLSLRCCLAKCWPPRRN